MTALSDDRLLEVGRRRVGRVERASDRFFEAEADAVSAACRAMASRFHRGGRLLAFGEGASRTDADHTAVEFVHPVLVGKRALPALALRGDPGERIRRLGEPADIALGLSTGPASPAMEWAFRIAGSEGLLTVAVLGEVDGAPVVDHRFRVRGDDPTVVQEVQETLYHVLWELVHVFFDHRSLLE